MTATFIIVLFAVISLGYFVFAASRHLTLRADSELLPVDLKSLATLIDSDQTEYLRHALTAQQFRFYEREQKLVVADYVKRISHNSKVVIARANGVHAADRSVESQNFEILQLAMHTRTMCMSALVQLYLSAYIPWFRSPLQQVASIHNAANRFFPKLLDHADGLALRTSS
jgi:hypothetical protein